MVGWPYRRHAGVLSCLWCYSSERRSDCDRIDIEQFDGQFRPNLLLEWLEHHEVGRRWVEYLSARRRLPLDICRSNKRRLANCGCCLALRSNAVEQIRDTLRAASAEHLHDFAHRRLNRCASEVALAARREENLRSEQ